MSGPLFSSENLGRTPFYFWYGMVVGGKEWEDNQKDEAIDKHKIHTRDDVAGWGHRCKVCILGYDPHIVDDKSVKNSELVMAEVMVPTTGGGGIGGPVSTPTIGNNSFVVGFFKDGVSAREPIIMGVLPNVSQTRTKEYDFPEKTRYIASTGYRPGEDKVANDAFWGEGPSVMETGEMVRPFTVMLKAQLDDGKRMFGLPTTYNCDRKCGGEMNKIQLVLQQLMDVLQLSKAASWAAKASDALKNYGAIVANATNMITAYVQKIMQDIRSNVINTVNRTVDDVLDSVIPPNERSKTADTSTNKLIDGITCAFNFIMKGLKGIIGNFLKNMIGGAVNALSSTAEGILGTVLTSVLGPITSAVGGALSALGGLFGSALSLAGGILNALNVVFGALNIFSCKEELQCAAVNSWSWLYGETSSSGCSGGGLDGLFSLFDSFGDSLDQVGDSISNLGEALNQSQDNLSQIFNANNIREETAPILSGPPIVTTSGGGVPSSSPSQGTSTGTTVSETSTGTTVSETSTGTTVSETSTGTTVSETSTGTTTEQSSNGFRANPVVSPKGEILALDIIDGGSGYTSPPNIRIFDPTGSGRGAVAVPIMKGGDEIEFDRNGCGKPEVQQKYPNIKENIPPLSSKKEKDLSKNDNKTEYQGGGPLENKPLEKLTPSLIPLEDDELIRGQTVDKVVIIDSGVGYLQKPDGSTGAGGSKISNPEDTIVYCGGYNVYPPCSNVQVSEGEKIYLPLGTLGQIFDSEGTLIQSSTGLGPTTPIEVIKSGTLATPCVTRDEVLPIVPDVPLSTFIPTQYEVALEIGDIYIEDLGINYSPDDVITIEPANGAELKPKYDEVGRVVDVEIVNPGIGFTEFPKIRIYSNTGHNANIIPIFNVIRITNEALERDIVPPGTPLISVIDCVGIQPPKREFEVVPQ